MLKIYFNNRSRKAFNKTLISKTLLSSVSKSGKILRKLDSYELVLNEQCSNGYLQILYTIIFDFNKDLYRNLNKLTNAIKRWKSQHPFLNCTVLNKDQTDHLNKKIIFERYFVEILSNNDSKLLKNVQYLEYKQENSSTNADETIIWSKLNDLFLNYPIPIENEYLWRLIFIKLTENRYCLIFNCHHEIASGKTAHCLTKQLLGIINAIYNDKPLTNEFYNTYGLPESLETHLYKKNAKIIEEIRLSKEEIELNRLHFIVPKCICEPTQSNTFLDLSGSLFDYEKKSTFGFYKQNMPLNARAEKFKFNKIMTQKLFFELKKKNVKPTACFGTIISAAVHKAFMMFNVKQSEIIYGASVNLNQFLTEYIKNGEMGYYGTRAIHKIETKNFDKILNEDNFDTLWNVSRTEGEKTRRIIHEKRMLEYPQLRKYDIECMSKSKYNPDEGNYENSFKVHFILSNIGSIEKLPEFIGNFKILDLYCETTTPNYGINSQLFIAYLLITADELHIAFEINTTLKNEFMKCVIDTVRKSVENILAQGSD